MPEEYSLGKAHGTVRVDYEGTGAKDAREDVEELGEEAKRTEEKIDSSTSSSKKSFEDLGEAAKRAYLSIDDASIEDWSQTLKQLERDAAAASASAQAARARLEAAENTLRMTRERGNVTAQEVAQAELGLARAQRSTINAAQRLTNVTSALQRTRERMANSNVSVEVDVDERGFASLVARLREIEQHTRESARGINTFSGRLKFMVAAVALATPGIAGLGVSLVALAGTAGVAAGALAAVGATAATVAAGTAGVGDAFKEASNQAKNAGSAATSSAKAQRAAAKAIEQARRSLMDAEENLARVQEDSARAAIQAARAVAEAQRGLIEAQRDAVRAQQNLVRARQEAIRQLEDMRDALTGGAFDERQAVLDLQDAQEELNRVQSDPTSTERERQQAILNLERQQFALEELREENQRLATDQAAAAQAGVEGSEQVVNAQESVRDSAQGIIDAQQALADAQENVQRVQVDSARAVADAVQQIVDAQEGLQEAYLDSAEAGTAAGAKLEDAMNNLSPNARAFVTEVMGMRDAWDAVRRSVQERLFEGLAEEVQPLANEYFPILEKGMSAVADALNKVIHLTVDYLHTAEAQGNVANIFRNTGLAIDNMATIVRDLLAAFLDIASVGSDFLPDMATDAANAAARFREFIAAAKESGSLRQWMQDGMDATSQLAQLLENLGSIIGTVFSGLDQGGGGALNTLTELTGQIDEFLKSAEGQEALHALGRVLASIGGAVGRVFLSFLDVAADLLVRLEPFIVAFADAAGVYLAAALQGIQPILAAFASVIGFLGPGIGPVVAGIYAMNKAVGAAQIAFGLLNTTMKANPFILIASAVIALVYLIITNWDTISAKLSEIWEGIKNAAAVVWSQIEKKIIDPIKAAWQWLVDAWNTVSTWVTSKFDEIKRKWDAQWQAVGEVLKNAITAVKDWFDQRIQDIVGFFRDLPGKVLSFLRELPGKMLSLGEDIVRGLVRGIGNFASAVKDKIMKLARDAWNAVKDFFGISSPSRLTAYAGEMIGQGLADGIASMAGRVSAAATELSDAAATALTGSVGTLAANVALRPEVGALGSLDPATLPVQPTGGGLGGGAAAAASGGGGRVVHIENVTVHVSGNLDPTNPVAFRQTIVKLKDAIRDVDREYA